MKVRAKAPEVLSHLVTGVDVSGGLVGLQIVMYDRLAVTAQG